jgi:phosphopentomutase
MNGADIMSKAKVLILVLDSLGVGALPDAEKYGDIGADTFGNVAAKMQEQGGFEIPNLLKLGLGNIDMAYGGKLKQEFTIGSFGRLSEKSKGKDTITGHWELAGLYTEVPFKTYPDGFPAEFMARFEAEIGVATLGNFSASGTEIIEKLGAEHEKTGKPIIYTSADSVFQVAANVDVISLERLYEICEIARKMLVGDVACGRVIARPYVFENGKRVRTGDRKDYAVSPHEKTLLDNVKDAGQTVYAIGKINDVFNGQGVTTSVKAKNNDEVINKMVDALAEDFGGLIFANLIDFDSEYGHRRDPIGYGKALEALDKRLPEIMHPLKDDDVLILCADHGTDPTHVGWDHTREYVPVVIYGKKIKAGINLGTRGSFADVGATAAEILNVQPTIIGASFYKKTSTR